MNAIHRIARPDIVSMRPYAHAEWRPALVRLHANEAPWRPAGDSTQAGLNRYPEPQPAALLERLAQLYNVPAERLLATHGSDEAIDVLSRIFLRAGQDAILQCSPTFGMYQAAALIQGGAVIDVPLARSSGWQIDPERLIAAWRPQVKIVYICSPNNPTGNLMPAEALERLCESLDGKAIIVVDEAYIEWSRMPSQTRNLERFETLAVLRTLSKAHALAGARCGALIAHPELIRLARRIVPPYSIAQPTIEAAMRALTPTAIEESRRRIDLLLGERECLGQALMRSASIEKVWPSDANFLMVDCPDPQAVFERAIQGGYIVRDLRSNPALPRSLRISIGTREQSAGLIRALEAA